jgi:uncharacterized protein (DUF1697 family)
VRSVPNHVALLRGVNVGGKNKVPMAELRLVFESLGYADVSTYIQSGNVVFSADGAVSAERIETAVAKRFGIEPAVVLRTARELRRIVEGCPFGGAHPSKLHVGLMARRPEADVVKGLDGEPFRPDEFVVAGRDVYLHLPNGMGRAKLPAYLERQVQVPVTIRNWRTVTKLVELTSR